MKYKDEKKELLNNGVFSFYLTERKKMALNGQFQDIDTDYGLDQEDARLCEQMRKARYEQIKKIEEHIKFWFNKSLNKSVLFCTFTFNDMAMEQKPATRKKAIVTMLNRTDDYLLNIDYGARNEREHYHAIVLVPTSELYTEDKHLRCHRFDDYRKGFYSVEEVRREDKDKKRLSRYVTKLTLHSIKVKQTYVSVKKGTEYQEFKKEIERIKNDARNGFGEWKNEEQRYDSLEALQV